MQSDKSINTADIPYKDATREKKRVEMVAQRRIETGQKKRRYEAKMAKLNVSEFNSRKRYITCRRTG